ncbi:MAG TPA: glycoside hydrolase family 32 protein [Propionibacteriaceae bacterium]|nr:glycoside hydrolase family 32 protein [Propionibacteriaceae bacterium]
MPDNPIHHVPQFHIRLPRGFLNDPNGPIEVDGTVHLFFQSRSTTDTAQPVEWGHATSPDLVHWTLHRPAMSPVPGGPDADGCWSGNTVLADGELRAYYSGKLDHSSFQSVLLARFDRDAGSFGAPVQVVDDPADHERITMFRDPFVWREDGGWRMAVGAAGTEEASIRHYRSADGVRWRYEGPLASLPRTVLREEDTGEGWECPQILPVDGAEVALVSAWSHGEGPSSVLAFPLGGTPQPHRVDHGQNFYAASVMREGSRGPLVFGWVTEGRDRSWWRDAGWAGAISLPRRAWLVGDRLASEPHPDVEALRVGSARPADGAVIGAQAEIAVPATTGTLRLRFGDDEHLDIHLDRAAGTVAIDRDAASADERAHGGQAVAAEAFDPASERPGVRVFVDGSVVEVFTSAGRSFTTRVYPLAAPPWRIEAPEGSLVWDLGTAVHPVVAAR